ncbi:MAG: hypothetical protein NTW08_01220 [Gammaproteobacteria bacterium]|nr:hypothetical protein [Gammaproteobacteria bacterium]
MPEDILRARHTDPAAPSPDHTSRKLTICIPITDVLAGVLPYNALYQQEAAYFLMKNMSSHKLVDPTHRHRSFQTVAKRLQFFPGATELILWLLSKPYIELVFSDIPGECSTPLVFKKIFEEVTCRTLRAAHWRTEPQSVISRDLEPIIEGRANCTIENTIWVHHSPQTLVPVQQAQFLPCFSGSAWNYHALTQPSCFDNELTFTTNGERCLVIHNSVFHLVGQLAECLTFFETTTKPMSQFLPQHVSQCVTLGEHPKHFEQGRAQLQTIRPIQFVSPCEYKGYIEETNRALTLASSASAQ